MKDFFSKIIKLDKNLSEFIFKLRPKSSFIESIVKLSIKGFGVGPLFLAAILFSTNKILTTAIFLFIGLISFFLFENFVKKTIRRERPQFLEERLNSYSFPSTHALCTTMSTAHILSNPALYPITPLLLIGIILWMIYILLGRVIYGHHYILDVLGGAIIGVITYLPLHFHLQQIVF